MRTGFADFMPSMRLKHLIQRTLVDKIFNEDMQGFLETLLCLLKRASGCRQVKNGTVSDKLLPFLENTNWDSNLVFDHDFSPRTNRTVAILYKLSIHHSKQSHR